MPGRSRVSTARARWCAVRGWGSAATLRATANRFRRAEAAPPAGARRAKRRDEVRDLRDGDPRRERDRAGALRGRAGLPVGSLPARCVRGRGDRHRIRPGEPLVLRAARHGAGAALPDPAEGPGEAGACGPRRDPGRGGGHTPRLSDLRPPRRRGAERGELEAALHSRRFRPRLLHARAGHRGDLQALGRVRAGARAGATLERPGARDRVARVRGRGDPLPQGPDAPTSFGARGAGVRVNVLVTGGLGFIGSNLIRLILSERRDWRVVNLDLITYAANPANLAGIEEGPRYRFVRGDV